ncbi:hypothetical protein STRAU_7120 [Streptomyces aurantiacus JA 4570]|uniref:Uncharacterized protein n=1 Tax=Streptomyces aurantiacus JA 4570 TaxID=1286094 RepID=S3ZB49_9ACTN|nr:hypothetical protein STRAU_7120 [Streptomyces aurantiacus JA 4570]
MNGHQSKLLSQDSILRCPAPVCAAAPSVVRRCAGLL